MKKFIALALALVLVVGLVACGSKEAAGKTEEGGWPGGHKEVTVLIPAENEKDLARLERYITEEITFIPCKTVDDVLKHALVTEATDATHPVIPTTQTHVRSHHESEYRADNT